MIARASSPTIARSGSAQKGWIMFVHWSLYATPITMIAFATEFPRRFQKDRPLHGPLSAAGRHEEVEHAARDEGLVAERLLRRDRDETIGEESDELGLRDQRDHGCVERVLEHDRAQGPTRIVHQLQIGRRAGGAVPPRRRTS